MDEIERQRLQALVDAVHLTCAAARAMSSADAAATAFGRMRAGVNPPGTTWRPLPVPRGWLPVSLGTESEMFVPYLSPFMSHVVPVYPGIGSPGLIHSGVGHMGSGIPMGVGVPSGHVPYGSYGSYVSPGIYGYRPMPYGVGLVHAGYEGSIPGGINPLFGISPMMSGYGPSMMPGIGPSMMSMPMGSPMSGSPMQPAWSPVQMQPSI